MRWEGAVSMHTVRAFADYFLWEEFMRSRVFPIFYRVVPVNAAKRKSKVEKWLDTPESKTISAVFGRGTA